MQIIRTHELHGTSRDVRCPDGGFRSLRILLRQDGMGFGLHKTIIPKGFPQHWHYTHHLEACYCIQGSGLLENLMTGEKHDIYHDTIYVLDKHDDHLFTAFEEVTLICIFNPPLAGEETHREDRSYAPANLMDKLREVKSMNERTPT